MLIYCWDDEGMEMSTSVERDKVLPVANIFDPVTNYQHEEDQERNTRTDEALSGTKSSFLNTVPKVR